MAIDIQQYALNATTPTLIAHATFNPMRVLVHNHEHANNRDVYVGGSAVTTSNGFHILPTETIEFFIAAGDILYAIASHANVDVCVARSVM
jgi:hypothetical protein